MGYFKVSGSRGGYPFIDGLRALAIFLVLLRHAAVGWGDELVGWGWNAFYNGWLGVDLFFVLSGFLIADHLLSQATNKNKKAYLRRYFAKRSLRILPLYVSILIIIGVGVVPMYEPFQALTLANLSVHVLFLQDYIPAATLLVPLWSLAAEEKFYLLAPFVFLLLGYVPVNRLFVGLIGMILGLSVWRIWATLTFDAGSYNFYFWDLRAPFHFSVIGILCGVGAAMACRVNFPCSSSWVGFQFLKVICWVAVLSVLFMGRWIEGGSWLAATLSTLVLSVAISLLIVCSVRGGQVDGVLGKRYLRYWAKLSYALYLCHMLFIPLSLWLAACLGVNDTIAELAAFFVFYLLLSWSGSLFLHLVFEKPFLLIKDRL